MLQRGRKSAADLAAPPPVEELKRLEPPEHLNDDEKTIFAELVEACAPQHFAKSDLPLLAAYAQSILLSREAAKEAGSAPSAMALWEKAVKVMATLATRLRLSPQSRADPKTVARHMPSHLPRPWEKENNV
jgi:hypothetical protein